jgi:uncharacterized protein
MNQQERELIQSLFDRLEPAAAQPKDAEAEALISSRVSANRSAGYLLTQMAIVHEHALQGAQNRIAELEQQLATGSGSGEHQGSFLGGLLGNSPWGRKDQVAPSRPGAGAQARGNIRMPDKPLLAEDQRPFAPAAAAGSVPAAGAQYARGPSFLQGAMSTAVGVAGGVVLGSMLSNMLSHNSGSPVAEAAAKTPEAAAAREESASPWSTAKNEEPAKDEPKEPAQPEHDTAQDTHRDDGQYDTAHNDHPGHDDVGADFGGDAGGDDYA